jgi:DNA polymerase V
MIGLVDCNNFYVSCERAFNPALKGRPVIVLSNNDGCAISRKMGAPAFLIKDLIKKNGVEVFSSNYTLYGDMSQRVMSTLSGFVPEIEIYSIDEAFLYFDEFSKYNLVEYGRKIISTVNRDTGIPVSMGIGPTKTLAKMANKLAKRNENSNGVFVIEAQMVESVLKNFPIEDVWGIGSQHAKFLRKNNITSAYDFTQFPGEWVRKNLTVVGLRMWDELRGQRRITPEFSVPSKKNICTSRSFGNMQTDYAPIEEATATYAARCAEKLRKQKTCARVLMVFLHTNQFREDLPQYARNIVINLPVPSNSSLELVKFAKQGLKCIYKKGFAYKKSGIIVSDFIPEEQIQQNIFDTSDRKKESQIMKVMDSLNFRHGRDSVRIATQGFEKSWHLRQELMSRRYTTRMSDIINIHV